MFGRERQGCAHGKIPRACRWGHLKEKRRFCATAVFLCVASWRGAPVVYQMCEFARGELISSVPRRGHCVMAGRFFTSGREERAAEDKTPFERAATSGDEGGETLLDLSNVLFHAADGRCFSSAPLALRHGGALPCFKGRGTCGKGRLLFERIAPRGGRTRA